MTLLTDRARIAEGTDEAKQVAAQLAQAATSKTDSAGEPLCEQAERLLDRQPDEPGLDDRVDGPCDSF